MVMFVVGLVCTGVLGGLILAIEGVPAKMENVRVLLVWVPFTTVIFDVAAEVSSDVGTNAVN